jgi:puromycin-sensitive aminopeptidase
MADDDDGPAAVTSATASVSPSSVSVPVPDLTRLPKDIVPKRYELKMDVDPLDKKYKGLVNIRLYFNAEETTVIWLHASKNVNIVSAHLRFSQFGELPVEAAEVIFVPDSECIGIRFITPIKEGTRAWLGIHFKGDISDGMQGLFSAPYLDKNGERQLGAATMFAATEARTCFPCFDEPEFKAVFALEITVDDHLTVISNMPVMDSTYSVKKPPDVGKRKRTDFFEWTKEMSTYLVCFVIGQYEYLETKAGDHGRTRVRVYTPWGQREQGRFGLQVAKKSLEFFNDYFATRYPLPKLDLVALSRLSVGAMENWGVITCREAGLITDDKDSDPYTLQRVATLIAHEISHQWFGNLVTMKWWDGLYLNEGFATLMQYMCIDKIFPEYKVFNKFCSETVMPALGLDALQVQSWFSYFPDYFMQCELIYVRRILIKLRPNFP